LRRETTLTLKAIAVRVGLGSSKNANAKLHRWTSQQSGRIGFGSSDSQDKTETTKRMKNDPSYGFDAADVTSRTSRPADEVAFIVRPNPALASVRYRGRNGLIPF
jgi:hypothetical protein